MKNDPDLRLIGVARHISDGTRVDWVGEESLVDGESLEERRLLVRLRQVQGIAEFHRLASSMPFGDDAPGDGVLGEDTGKDVAGTEGPGADVHGADVAGADSHAGETPLASWGGLTLLEVIGRGSFGEVYRGFDPRLEREVALKLLRPHRGDPDTLESAVLREGRHLARLRHPNVITVYGAERHEGRAGLWMELVKGRTLEEIIRTQGPLGALEAAVIGAELCQAVAAVHGAGLVHRDIKAQNILREEGGRIVLMDLGLGGISEEQTRERGAALAGTPLYMAPEILEGGPATVASDIYSLGVVLHHLVTGGYPVEAGSLDDLRRAHRDHWRRSLRDIRPGLARPFIEVVERALARAPRHRFKSAGDMEAALASVLGRIGSAPADERDPDTGAGTSVRKAVGHRSRVLPFALAAALLLAVVLAFVIPRNTSFEIEASLFGIGEGGMRTPLQPGSAVGVGDYLGLDVWSSRKVYLYVINEDERGDSYLLFPLPGFLPANPLPPDAMHRLPGRSDGRELFWQVSSAHGRERLLLLASPGPLPEVEAEVNHLPTPQEGAPPNLAVRLSADTERLLRGIGSLGQPHATTAGGGTVARVRRLAQGREQAEGLWVREIDLWNPAR